VAKRKNPTALFEAISRTREKDVQSGLNVPTWMGEGEADSPQMKAQPRTEPAAPSQPSGGRTSAAKTAGQLQLSLNYVSCIAIGVVAVLLLAGAFWVGRVTARLGGEAGPAELPATGETAAVNTAALGQVPPAAPTRIAGKYYLVIQQLNNDSAASKVEAQRISDFCGLNNEKAEVRKFEDARGKQFWAVWSLTPLDSDRSSEAENHAKAIEAMGKRYFAKYQTYNFQQRARPDGELQAYYVRYE